MEGGDERKGERKKALKIFIQSTMHQTMTTTSTAERERETNTGLTTNKLQLRVRKQLHNTQFKLVTKNTDDDENIDSVHNSESHSSIK